MKYIDTNILIYAIENHPKYGKSCKKILEDVQKGKIKAEASLLVLIDSINVLNKINKELRKSKEKELDISEMIIAIESIKINWLDINFLTIERA
jgi:predicted nucleic acid-binding protein